MPYVNEACTFPRKFYKIVVFNKSEDVYSFVLISFSLSIEGTFITDYMSGEASKMVFGVSNQVPHKPVCTITEG